MERRTRTGARASGRPLITAPSTGAVLGLETVFTEADRKYGVKAGDVMDRRAWMR